MAEKNEEKNDEQIEETPKPVADAPDTTTPKVQDEDPTKLEKADE
jgi:hypothetical protein